MNALVHGGHVHSCLLGSLYLGGIVERSMVCRVRTRGGVASRHAALHANITVTVTLRLEEGNWGLSSRGDV